MKASARIPRTTTKSYLRLSCVTALLLTTWSLAVVYFMRRLEGGGAVGITERRNTFDIAEYFSDKANFVIKDNEKKRYVLDNFLSTEEISIITSMIHRSERMLEMDELKHHHNEHDHKTTWFTNIFQLDDSNPTEVAIAKGVRRRALKLVKHIFESANGIKIYVETCNFSILRSVDDNHDYHLPGIISQTYSHGLHCDNCNLHYENMSCTPFWTHARHYTAIIYVKPAEKGGDLSFYDFNDVSHSINHAIKNMTETTIEAVPGRVVIFDSGPKNYHAVKRMFGDGDRISVSLWMTRDRYARESLRQQQGPRWLRRVVGNGDDDI